MNWQASTSTGVTGYKVYRSTISGGYYGLLASLAGLTFTDTAVQAGATYYYVLLRRGRGEQRGIAERVFQPSEGCDSVATVSQPRTWLSVSQKQAQSKS